MFAYGPGGRREWPGDPDHFCRDRYGNPIPWHRTSITAAAERGAVELDHVKVEPMMSRKAPDDEAHLVVVCYGAHHAGLATSAGGRKYERDGLASMYPQVWAEWSARQRGEA